MGFFSDFKDFIARGNVLDLAIGVVIGAAFTAVVNAIVSDMLTPFIEWMFPYSFENLFVHLRCPGQNADGKCSESYMTYETAKKDGAVIFAYGHTIQVILQFMFTAFVLFLILRMYMRIRKPGAAQDKKCTYCIQSVNIRATRCQHCGGQLTANGDDLSIKSM